MYVCLIFILAISAFGFTSCKSPGLINPVIIGRDNITDGCPPTSHLRSARETLSMRVMDFLPQEGWTEVADLDMTNSSHHCPSPWTEVASPARLCDAPSCSHSVTFTVPKKPYSRVRGRITGYGTGGLDAFYQKNTALTYTIDIGYLDGVSVTHGTSPRHHIWSLASGYYSIHHQVYAHCPCELPSIFYSPAHPSFVGDNYFCDGPYNGLLWDGRNCTTNCCSFNDQPWFNVTLSSPTSDDIEVRICTDEPAYEERIYVQKIQLFVQ